MIPRYLYPIEEELPIPHYFSKLELGIEEKVEEQEKPKRSRRSKKKSKLRRKIKTHRKSIR